MIEIEKVNFRYLNSKKSILQDFSLNISEGEIVGIIGPTGSGKSTICYLFNGLIPHTIKGIFTGSIIIDGKNTADASVEEMDDKLNEIIQKLNISHLRYRQTANLSEGEKQKVILASILTMEPKILVLDESSSMVDTTSKINLMKTLKDLNQKEQKTIIIIDHDLDFIAQIATRILLINDGKIIEDDTPSNILTDVKLLRENGLIPATIPSLFYELKGSNLPVSKIPTSSEEATKILVEWLS